MDIYYGCNKCNIKVYSQHKECPLCGKRLGNPCQSDTSYPLYVAEGGQVRLTFEKFILFATITASVISVFINIFTLAEKLTLWSFTVTASLIAFWLIIHSLLMKKANIGRKIIYNYGIISAYLITIDALNGFSKWSTTYVIPFLTVAVAAVFTGLAASNINGGKNFREYSGILTAIFFISFCPVILFALSLSVKVWTSLISALYCLLTIIGLLIFAGKRFRHEIKKRFHF